MLVYSRQRVYPESDLWQTCPRELTLRRFTEQVTLRSLANSPQRYWAGDPKTGHHSTPTFSREELYNMLPTNYAKQWCRAKKIHLCEEQELIKKWLGAKVFLGWCRSKEQRFLPGCGGRKTSSQTQDPVTPVQFLPTHTLNQGQKHLLVTLLPTSPFTHSTVCSRPWCLTAARCSW